MMSNETLPNADAGRLERGVRRVVNEGTGASMLKMKHLDGALRQEQMQDRVAARLEPQPARTVADIPDAELLGRVVRSVTRKRPRRQEFAWVAVMEAFGLGSTYASQLCTRYGIDPDTGADLNTPNA